MIKIKNVVAATVRSAFKIFIPGFALICSKKRDVDHSQLLA
jgi:hypothetical protein